jgi:energy-coupling factor transport system ATP-binding protein
LEEVLRIENLTHTYGKGTPFERNAVENIDFSVMRGEYLGIIGHTGSGKSTFIQHLNGLLKPTEGRVLLDGEDIWKNTETTRKTRFRVGLVFQYPEYQLFEETVYKDISFGPKNMGLGGDEVDRRVRDAARIVGIDDAYLNASPFELSGGQKRRAAIAGVIAMEPEVLILDEPTAGLDPVGCRMILSQIRAYHEEKGTTIILVSHSMEDIAANCGRIAVFDKARIVMQGAPAEVFSHAEELNAIGLDVPQAAQVAALLRERGVAVGAEVYTVDALAKFVLSLRGGGRGA